MFCYRCGHKLRDDADYCSFCGTPVDKTEETSPLKDCQCQSNPSKDDMVDTITDDKNDKTNLPPQKTDVVDEIGKGSLWIFKGIGKTILYLIICMILVKTIISILSVASGNDPNKFLIITTIFWGIFYGLIDGYFLWFISTQIYHKDEYIWQRRSVYPLCITAGILGGISWAFIAGIIIFIVMVIHIRYSLHKKAE